jgi:hypothetical protein
VRIGVGSDDAGFGADSPGVFSSGAGCSRGPLLPQATAEQSSMNNNSERQRMGFVGSGDLRMITHLRGARFARRAAPTAGHAR